MGMTMNDDWGESDSERQVRLGCEKKIESLQAEIRKKDQEIADQKEDIVHYKAALEVSDDQYRENQEQLMAKDARIKDLEQQLAKQQAYIGRLEAGFKEAYEAEIYHGSKRFGIEYTDENMQQKAKDALEKLKTG